MKISPNTKISALIKANPDAIEAIASISSHFEKLRNPLLRKILASRVTIADAARIGGSEVAVFFEKLSAIGFEPEGSSDNLVQSKTTETKKPADLPAQQVELDVREALKSGNDPFSEIMDALDKLPAGHALKLINTFEPTPLISILKKRGFTYFTETLADDLIHTYFYRSGITTEEKTAENPATDKADTDVSFAGLVQQYEGRIKIIDVRELEMPLPMVTILQTLTTLTPDEALFVYHKRLPQFLLPQLAERGLAYATEEVASDQVHMLIYKNQTSGSPA